jgi:hypothetical protein
MKTRKTNKAKRVDSGCANHGSCKVCQGNRTHANRRAEPADSKEQLRGLERDTDLRVARGLLT